MDAAPEVAEVVVEGMTTPAPAPALLQIGRRPADGPAPEPSRVPSRAGSPCPTSGRRVRARSPPGPRTPPCWSAPSAAPCTPTAMPARHAGRRWRPGLLEREQLTCPAAARATTCGWPGRAWTTRRCTWTRCPSSPTATASGSPCPRRPGYEQQHRPAPLRFRPPLRSAGRCCAVRCCAVRAVQPGAVQSGRSAGTGEVRPVRDRGRGRARPPRRPRPVEPACAPAGRATCSSPAPRPSGAGTAPCPTGTWPTRTTLCRPPSGTSSRYRSGWPSSCAVPARRPSPASTRVRPAPPSAGST